MNDRGTLNNRSLSELRFSSDGGSVELFLTDSVPPYGTVVLTCQNVLAFHLHRTAEDAAPYFLAEIGWHPSTAARPAQALAKLGYSFFNEQGNILEPGWNQMMEVHFEGSVCGDILCRGCLLHEEESVSCSSPAG